MNNQKSHYLSLLLTFIAASIFIAAGGFGLYYFANNSNYMVFIGRRPPGTYAYNVKDALTLLLFSTAAPIGFLLMLHFTATMMRIMSFNKYSPSPQKLSTFVYTMVVLATASTFITISVFSYRWSHHVLQCGIIGCLGDSWPLPGAINPPIRASGEGFKSTIAAPAILISAAIVLSLIVILGRELLNTCLKSCKPPSTGSSFVNKHGINNSALNEQLLDLSPTSDSDSDSTRSVINSQAYTPFNTTFQINSANGTSQQINPFNPHTPIFFLRLTIQFILLFILFSSMFVVASYVPNQFRSYWPSKIADFAKLEVVNDPERCLQWGEYTCPELYNATFRTRQIRISDDLNLKLFPSNTIFYTFIIFAMLFPVVTRMIPPVDRFLSRKVVISVPSIFFLCQSRHKPVTTLTKVYWSVFEIVLLLWFILGSYLFFSYCIFDRNWKEHQAWEGHQTTFWDKMMRASGQFAVIFLSLLMFPVARSSPLLSLLGVGWDKAINVHRWLGVLFLLMSIWHMLASYIFFYKEIGWKGVVELLWPFPPFESPVNQDNFTIPVIQAVTWLMMITIGVVACYEPIRRRAYDFFLISHHITYILLIPTVLWHAQCSWEYLLPALSLYIGDRLLRFYRGVQSVSLHPTFINDFQPNLLRDPTLHNNASFTSSLSAGTDGNEDPDTHSVFSPRSVDFNRKLPTPITTIYAPKKHHSIPAPLSGPNNLSSHQYNTNSPGVRLLDCGAAGKFVEINIVNAATDFVYFPGHFFFINIAEISLFEYHPMTVSSAVHAIKSNTVSFLIKCTGNANSWTNNLYNYIDKIVTQQLPTAQYDNPLDIPLTVSLDGPYGHPIDFSKYNNVILCGAGSGITPVKSIYESLWLSFLHDFVPALPGDGKGVMKHHLLLQHSQTAQGNLSTPIPSNSSIVQEDSLDSSLQSPTPQFTPLKHVHLFAAARDPSLFECMVESLANIPKNASPFTAELLCSQNGAFIPIRPDPDEFTTTNPTTNRCTHALHNIKHHFSSQHRNQTCKLAGQPETLSTLERSICDAFATEDLHSFKQSNQQTIIFVCGPDRLANEARSIAMKYSWQFHEESFEF